MLRFLADEGFDNNILHGCLLRLPELDLIRVQDVALDGANDPTVLGWAASDGRVLLTHDVSTMPEFAYDRMARGLPTPGVFVIKQVLPVGQAIEAILLMAHCSHEGEWEGQVVYLPL